jgi:hypothetical protein
MIIHTFVICLPDSPSPDARNAIGEGLMMLGPYITAMSMEDEMTILELIEQHDEFDSRIADEARAKTKEIHATAAAAVDSILGRAAP